MPSIAVGIHVKGWLVQVPALSVPTLKSLARTRDPPGVAVLNWKVRGPGLLSVAVTVHLTGVPITCGDRGDGVIDTICTVANAGAHSTVSSPMKPKMSTLRLLMEFSLPVNWLMSIPYEALVLQKVLY